MTASTDFADALSIFLRHARAFYDASGTLSEAQRTALRGAFRRLIRRAAAADHTLELAGADLFIDGAEPAPEPGGKTMLVERMRLHGVRRIVVRRGASGEDLLLLGRLLASEPTSAPPEPLALWHVQLSYTATPDEGARPSELHAAITTAGDAERVLAQLVARTRGWAAAGHTAGVKYALTELRRLDLAAADPAVRAACAQARTELRVAAVLRQFAELLPACDDPDEHLAVLRDYGEAAATALIVQLLAAGALRERRIYFDAIVALGRGRTALIDALGHTEWYVVRNAAALLGEMREPRAEPALARALRHADHRVRHAAAVALRQLGTPLGLKALQRMVDDPSPQLRHAAVDAFAQRPPGATATPLTAALDDEADEEVRLAILRALGRLATPDAVQRLTRTVLRRDARCTSVECRVTAVEALAQARGVAALPLLRSLTDESDPELSESARRLIADLALA